MERQVVEFFPGYTFTSSTPSPERYLLPNFSAPKRVA